MRTWTSLNAAVLIGLVGAGEAASLRGKVANAAGKPVVGAIVRWIPRGFADTTDAAGLYGFPPSTGAASSVRLPTRARFQDGELSIVPGHSGRVLVEVFEAGGRRLLSDLLPSGSDGVFRWNVRRAFSGSGLLLIKVTSGQDVMVFRHAAVANPSNGDVPLARDALLRSAALPETLVVAAKGYSTRRIPVSPSDTILDVVLDTVLAFGHPLRNAPHPSSGCGKPPGLGNGVHKMTSAGLAREYILSLPDGYDPSRPHRLVYGMHWMNGSAEAVQGWSKWFGLKALDTARSTIFVAPQGYTNGSPWRGDDKDHRFFDELNASLASKLCIDTTRVFSVGFSFGAMFTNALAQNHQAVLRGVVVYATADYNIYFPSNSGKPLAYMGVHGLKDPTCPIDAGRRSRDRFVKNNACATPSPVPEARSGGGHVVHDYKCPSSHPVRWATFDGGHTYPPNNSGTWVHGLTWQFITQF